MQCVSSLQEGEGGMEEDGGREGHREVAGRGLTRHLICSMNEF